MSTQMLRRSAHELPHRHTHGRAIPVQPRHATERQDRMGNGQKKHHGTEEVNIENQDTP